MYNTNCEGSGRKKKSKLIAKLSVVHSVWVIIGVKIKEVGRVVIDLFW